MDSKFDKFKILSRLCANDHTIKAKVYQTELIKFKQDVIIGLHKLVFCVNWILCYVKGNRGFDCVMFVILS